MDVEKTVSMSITGRVAGRGEDSFSDDLYLKSLKISIEITIICRFVIIYLENSKESNEVIKSLRKSNKVAGNKINVKP